MVSVIVPVYNVEKYLGQCLDSLRTQTLEDIEFIVIDDGSTDGSGVICDEYSRKDKRFKVFHTENRGLSAARNRGIDEAQGEWIEFVDSDDWVDEKFCEIPLRAAIENEADLVIFQRIYTTEQGRIKKKGYYSTPIGIISYEQAIDYGGAAAWNKLYKKDMFIDIKYPEGHVYEEVATTHNLIYRANQIVFLPDKLIFHRFRKNSISNKETIDSIQDCFSSHIKRYNDLILKGYPEGKEKQRLQNYALSFCVHMSVPDGELLFEAEKLLAEIDTIPKDWSWTRRLLLILWKKNKKLFNYICRITHRKV